MEAKQVVYRISFYPPGATSGDPHVEFDAVTPFQAISVGDELTGLTLGGAALESVAQVTKVVRVISDPGGEALHDTTLVFSEPVKGKLTKTKW